MRPSLAWQAVTLLAAAGCRFESTPPPDATTIACTADGAPCPNGYACRPAIGRCVPNSLVRQAPATIVEATLTPTIGGALTHFSLDFQVSLALAQAPTAAAAGYPASGGSQTEQFPFTCQPCNAQLSCHCDWTPDPSQLPAQGELPVSVSIVDLAGNNPAPIGVGSLTIDTTPPSLTGPATVILTPPPGVNTLVEALGNGAGVQVCFGVNETLGEIPVVWAGADQPDAGLSFALVDGYPQELDFCFAATLGAADMLPDGPAAAFAWVVDPAGNAATLPLLSPIDGGALLAVDRTPPRVPDLSEATGLRFHRAPWGELPTIGVPRLAVLSPAAALSEAGTLLVYRDPGETVELGRGFVAREGLVDVELAPVDQPAVWVDVADLGGNRLAAGPVRVDAVDWVVTLGLKEQDDATSNPHDCYSRARFGATLAQGDDSTSALDASTGPTGRDGGTTVVRGAASWRLRAAGLPDQTGLSYAYDPTRGVLTELQQDGVTSTFDGRDWASPPWPLQPTARLGEGIAFDRRRGRVVLFGGLDQTVFGNVLCDTWELGPSGWTLFPCGRSSDGGSLPAGLPAPRQSACMGYDEGQGWITLFGGTGTGGQTLTDAWTWNGAAWTPLPGSIPPANCLPNNLVYSQHLDGGGLILLAQADGGAAATWVGAWNGSDYRWSQSDANLPATAIVQALAIDPATGWAVAVVATNVDAGEVSQGLPVGLWTWDGSDAPWADAGLVMGLTLNPGMGFGLAPLPYSGSGASLDLLQSGGAEYADASIGCTLGPLQCQTIHAGGPTVLPTLYPTQLAVSTAGVAVMGAYVPTSTTPDQLQTWIWSGNDWGELPAGPPARTGAALGYLPEGGNFWLLGGTDPISGALLSDVWALNANDVWTQVDVDAGSLVLDGYELGLAPDAGLIGLGSGGPGLRLIPTDAGAQLQLLGDAGALGAWAFDPVRGRVVLADPYGTYLYEAAPPDFTFHVALQGAVQGGAVVTYDDPSESLLIVGGSPTNSAPILGQTQRWDGVALTNLPLTDPDADGNPDTSDSIIAPSLGYDPAGQRTLVVAPNTPDLVTGIWQLDLGKDRPGLACEFRFSAAQAPAGATFTELTINALAQSVGPDGGPAATDLSLWSGGTWRTVDACPTGCDSMTYTVTDPQRIGQLLADLQVLGIAVVPEAANTGGLAAISVEALQATLSYRLP